MFKTTILALLAVAAPVAVTAAPATQRVLVQTGDLDLTTAAGKHALNGRVASAVTQVCGVGQGSNFEDMQCRTAALAAAKPQIANVLSGNAPRLATIDVAPVSPNTASGS